MATLLPRPLTEAEQAIQGRVKEILLNSRQPRLLRGSLGKHGPLVQDAFFAAALSLIESPPASEAQRQLCQHLAGTPDFAIYIARQDCFSRPDLLAICRALLEADPVADVKLAAALRDWRDENLHADGSWIVRMLDALDEVSPGSRLTMTLGRFLRDPDPPVASKAALLMGRRVQNATWVQRHLSSEDARIRANVVEGLWNVDTDLARKYLRASLVDANNRVVGNALLGLYLAGDPEAAERLKEMLGDSRPSFRATAAWVMGKTGDPAFGASLATAVSEDSDPLVRCSAERAFAAVSQPAALAAGEG